ncbi:hypothetical protein KAH55_14760 [bacterium]|nr:hypothetical protein [bacterium]
MNILRYHSTPEWGKAVMLEIDPDHPEAAPQFRKIFNFPGGMSKFTIRYDPVSQKFWSLVNPVTKGVPAQRNVLSLTVSPDLEQWQLVADIWNYADADDYSGQEWDMKIGFQYVDWQFDGDDIIFASRTAFNGAHNFHNANYLTFERIRDFRTIR